MPNHLHRSIAQPIRENLTWPDRWQGPDGGLVFCWERGREMRLESPELAEAAGRGELIPLVWKGGVQEKSEATAPPKKASKSKPKPKEGTLYYLATWQGLRGQDLDVDVAGQRVIVCTRTKHAVAFSASSSDDEDEHAAS
jgi:hypothetical protein